MTVVRQRKLVSPRLQVLNPKVCADAATSFGLLLDERAGVSYPDGVEASDGTIYIIYDYSRRGEKQILLATFTEADMTQGKWLSAQARQRVLVNQATGHR